ncbi:hypothetical protein DAPPUDRAFT_311339 [Daphnia pulex]|uniref:Uncharacterized protein n=1 Tax=Daphnia pulex TaxID=6669 RepID=E9FWL1_DAPPU|nr:hypothetical protein DAPPUDRAFT_311339 [Daphnia pulex]|eukprot:EFX88414.1 hypothetical protein DAPPUDRAFT_311339 [Daphnia pulex]
MSDFEQESGIHEMQSLDSSSQSGESSSRTEEPPPVIELLAKRESNQVLFPNCADYKGSDQSKAQKNMGSKKKAGEDMTPEHGNPPKKRKIDVDSLLLEVDEQNVAYLKYLVRLATSGQQGTCNFSLSDQDRLVFIPALCDATISDQIFHILKGKYPDIELVKKEESNKSNNPDFLILPNADTEQLIEVLELVGAACVLYGNISAREYGWGCWYKATNLREENGISKTPLPQSETQKLAMRKKLEFQTVQELKELLRQKRTHWSTQAIFTCLRISKECDCFPNRFVVYNLFKFALEGWGRRKLPRHRAFAVSLHLFELFGHTEFLDELVENETNLEDVVHSTVTEFFNTLKDPQRNKTELAAVLTVDHLMTSLVFLFVYQVKVHDYARTHQIEFEDYTIRSKAYKLEEISQLILVILKLLVKMPKTKTQRKKLKNKLALYINIYELKRAHQKLNLLFRACQTYTGVPEDEKLIKLLLKAGGNPNAVDRHRRSGLHLLANKEYVSKDLWGTFSYYERRLTFTSIVRMFLNRGYHLDQVNLRGETAFEYLQHPRIPLFYNNIQFNELHERVFVRYLASLRKQFEGTNSPVNVYL